MSKMLGCPIHYYVIEYKEESQPTWRIVSNNIRSEEESIIIRLTMMMLTTTTMKCDHHAQMPSLF